MGSTGNLPSFFGSTTIDPTITATPSFFSSSLPFVVGPPSSGANLSSYQLFDSSIPSISSIKELQGQRTN